MLEIKVFEEVKVTDSLMEALAFIEKVIQRVLSGDTDIPVLISIRKVNSNSPPVLGINVSETSLVKDRLV